MANTVMLEAQQVIMRELMQCWGKLHGLRSIASAIATMLVLWGMALCTAAYGQTFPEPRALKINDRVFVLLSPYLAALLRIPQATVPFKSNAIPSSESKHSFFWRGD